MARVIEAIRINLVGSDTGCSLSAEAASSVASSVSIESGLTDLSIAR
jgi:hypothetical protein